MREKINTIFYDLASQCKRFDNIEEQILLQLHDKPACVQIETLVNEYEALHHHDYYEILYIEKGNVTYLLHEQTYNLQAGDLILIPPTSLHRLSSFDSNISSRFILLFSSAAKLTVQNNERTIIAKVQIKDFFNIFLISFLKK